MAIAGIDTRRLTRILREKGAQGGCIIAGPGADAAAARRAAAAFPGLKGMYLAKVVSVRRPYQWTEGSLWPNHSRPARPSSRFNVVAYEYGMKRNILRLLVDSGCRLTVLPAQAPAAEALALKQDGVFLSNGPGDPEPCDYAVTAIRRILETDIPVFGICLGHQLLALALGGKTYKLKFGHHGGNQPVMDLTTRKVEITSQNHGFAVDADSLQGAAAVTHLNLNDQTVEGLVHRELPIFSVQYHPESSPGPHDAHYLFRRFTDLMKKHQER